MDVKEEIKSIEEKLQDHSLDVVKIRPKIEKPKQSWSSKFGGKPYWPLGKDYPKTKNNEPLILLAQLNFDEIPHINEFPTKGVLQFFILDEDLYGLDFDNAIEDVISTPDTYRVIYHPEVITDEALLEKDLPEANNEAYLPLSKEYSLEFSHSTEMPSPTDYRFEEIAGDIYEYDDDVVDHISDKFDASGSKIGGYANFTQEDPRTMSDAGTWVLLFQMDTEYSDGIDIMWGDSGVGNFFIEPESLARCDFSRVWYNWDCC